MDKASAYGAEDCGFKSHRLCFFLPLINEITIELNQDSLINIKSEIKIRSPTSISVNNKSFELISILKLIASSKKSARFAKISEVIHKMDISTNLFECIKSSGVKKILR